MTNNTNIDFTRAAASKVHDLILEEGDDRLKLRVFISGGGCSGFQYGFTFDQQCSEDDIQIHHHLTPETNKTQNDDDDDGGSTGQAFGSATVTLLVDNMSYEYLKGATIDYRQDIHGEQFVIRNPNANTTCGCGSSFSVD